MNRVVSFTTLLLLMACADFDPDLGGFEDTMSEATGDGDPSGDGDPTTSGDGDGDGDGDPTTSGDGDGDPTTGDPTSDTCGNEVVEGLEECDGDPTTTCEEAGFFGGGTLGCSGDCVLDMTGCQELLYEQQFETGTVPAEVDLLGVVPPQIVDGNALYNYMGMYNGSCFSGADDFCVQMGPIDHNQTSSFRITLQFEAPGEIRSWVWGWTEKFDTLEFQLDGEVKCEYSLNFLGVVECVAQADPGIHQLAWIYRKDATLTEGLDTVWVDAITATNAKVL